MRAPRPRSFLFGSGKCGPPLFHPSPALTKLLGAAKVTQVHLRSDLDQIAREVGISDAIRQILAASKVTLSPTEIKAALVSRGFDLSGYANAGAVVHNTLLRLEKQGEIVKINDAYMAAPRRKSFGERLAEVGETPNPRGKTLLEEMRETTEKK